MARGVSLPRVGDRPAKSGEGGWDPATLPLPSLLCGAHALRSRGRHREIVGRVGTARS
jgi:hypothetical protein